MPAYPTPDWETPDGSIRLYCGDCLDILPTLPEGTVDAVVTDPPYSNATHSGARTRTDGANSDKLVEFNALSESECVAIFGELVRRSARWVVATCDWRFLSPLEAGGHLVRVGAWVKPNSAPQLSGDRPAMGWEAVAILHRHGRKRWNGGGSRATWICNRVDAKCHSTQKPLVLVEDFVRLFSDPGEVVLDPFMGSSTTGVACVNLGRRFIGIEKEPKYFDIAVKRIEDALGKGSLFDGIEEMKQGDLFNA